MRYLGSQATRIPGRTGYLGKQDTWENRIPGIPGYMGYLKN